MISDDKPAWRRRLLAERRGLPPHERARLGALIQERVATLPEWQSACCVGLYLALPDEVPTSRLIELATREGKRLAAPVLSADRRAMRFRELGDPARLSPGALGILQPATGSWVSPGELDLLVLPGVGFDLQGGRLGFGAGFYDRFLPLTHACRLGVAFDLQVVERLPSSPRDARLHLLQTERRLLRWPPRRDAFP